MLVPQEELEYYVLQVILHMVETIFDAVHVLLGHNVLQLLALLPNVQILDSLIGCRKVALLVTILDNSVCIEIEIILNHVPTVHICLLQTQPHLCAYHVLPVIVVLEKDLQLVVLPMNILLKVIYIVILAL